MTQHARAFAIRDQWIRDVGLHGMQDPNAAAPVALWSRSSGDRKLEWQIESRHDAQDGGTHDAELTWRARESPIRCTVRTTAPDDFPVATWTPTLMSASETTTDLYEDWYSLDALFGAGGTVQVSYATGSVATIDDFAPQSQTLRVGDSLQLQPGGGRSSSETLPFFLVDLGETAIVIAVAWTGEWSIAFDNSERGLHVTAGLDETRFKFLPGERFTGPGIAILFWSPDLDVSATNLWRRYVLAHHRPQTASGPVRPALSCATWGATPAQVHAQVIDQLQEEDLPFERYWIDAGWFGDRPDWWQNVGTWTANRNIWPDGLGAVSNMVHAQGRKFVLWFEPERACLDSQWHRDHPEWMLHTPEDRRIEPLDDREDPRWVLHYSRHTGNQGTDALFDLGNADARNHVIDFVSRCVTEWGIDVYRHDFNVAPLEFWRANDDEDRVGVTQLRYIDGLYTFFDELARRHPGLEIDNCASGGRRIDLNMTGRATPLSRSDYLWDPVGNQCHNYGLSTWVPLHATISHAGFGTYELRSAFTSGLSVSWATEFNQPETGVMELDFEKLRSRLAEFECVRDYFLGDFYPLTPYTTSESEWLAYQFHDPSRNGGVALAFRRRDCESTTLTVQLCGLGPDTRYTVQVDGQRSMELSGSDLAAGLTLVAAETPAAVLVTYTSTTEAT